MEHIFDDNYSKNLKIRDAVKDSFKKRLDDNDVDFHVLRHEGKIISFLTLEPQEEERTVHSKLGKQVSNNEIYFGSFNSFNGYKGGTVGEAMMRKVLDKEAEEKVIHADCPSVLPIGAKYIEDGFVAVRKYNYEGSPSFEIVRDDSISFESKKLSKEEIVKNYLQKKLDLPHDYKDLRIESSDRQEDLDFSLLNNENDGYVLTRYFKYQNDAKWYVVFDKM
jgi:hypothetical protein